MLIVDDVSTDSTLSLAEAHAARDPRVRVLRMPLNSGCGAARNRALELASGEIIAYLDADDEFYPDHFRQIHSRRTDGDVFVCRYDVVDERPGDEGRRWVFDPSTMATEVMRRNMSVPLGVAHLRALTEKLGAFDESVALGEDTKLWQKFAANGARFIFLSARSGLYHIRPNSQSRMTRVYDSLRQPGQTAE